MSNRTSGPRPARCAGVPSHAKSEQPAVSGPARLAPPSRCRYGVRHPAAGLELPRGKVRVADNYRQHIVGNHAHTTGQLPIASIFWTWRGALPGPQLSGRLCTGIFQVGGTSRSVRLGARAGRARQAPGQITSPDDRGSTIRREPSTHRRVARPCDRVHRVVGRAPSSAFRR